MKRLQSVPVDVKARHDLFEDGVASLVTECRGIIEDRLTKALAAVSGEVLAEQLWRGAIDPWDIRQALLGLVKMQGFLADLSTELSSLTAGLFQRPVLLSIALPDGCAARDRGRGPGRAVGLEPGDAYSEQGVDGGL